MLVLVEDRQRLAPRGLLLVVDLPQVEYGPLHGLACGDALVLDDAEVAVVFAVLLAICATEEHAISRMPESSTLRKRVGLHSAAFRNCALQARGLARHLSPHIRLSCEGQANGHWKRARALADQVIPDKPNDARANYWMARVRRQFKLLEDAEKFAAAAGRLDPQSSAHHRELVRVYFDRIEAASIVSPIGLEKKCRGELDTALKLMPNAPAVLYDQVLFYQQAPGIAGGRARVSEAIRRCRRGPPARRDRRHRRPAIPVLRGTTFDAVSAGAQANTLVRPDPACGYRAMAIAAICSGFLAAIDLKLVLAGAILG